MKKRPSETIEILDDVDVTVLKVVRGRPPIKHDDQLIDLARNGRSSGKYKSRNHAARELAKDAKGASLDANQKRLNNKFKNAGID